MSTLTKIHSLLTPAEHKSALLLLCFMSIGMILETLGIGLVIPALAIMLNNDPAALYPSIQPILGFMGNPTQTQMTAAAMLSLVGVYLLKNLYLAFLAWRQTRFVSGIQVQISQRLFATYLRQPYTFHLHRNSAQLIRNVYGEVNQFAGVISSTLTILTEGLVLLGISILLLLTEPMGALIVVLVLGGAAWWFQHSTRTRVTRWGKVRQYHDGLRIQHLQQGLGGAKEVKLLGRESDFLEQYSIHSIQNARMLQLQNFLQQLPRLWLELLAVIGLALLVLSMLGREQITTSIVPMLGLFAAAAFRLMPSIGRVLGAIQTLRYGLSVIDTLHKEFQLNAPDPSSSQIKNTAHLNLFFKKEIRLSSIRYTYPGATDPAINSISITIRKGESVGFIGPSGSGKSTLMDVILGLLSPNVGQILVDGQDIQKNLRAWQDQIGYVPQTIYLTDDTLRRNVAFGLPNEQIDDTAVQRAIEDAQLEEFIASLPDGLETMVGERGIRLSGGQRQRIGIARALYHDPPILILDEATSALDSATEQSVMASISALQGKKTILIVAHRLTTVEHCDNLYRLEQGKVATEATPT